MRKAWHIVSALAMGCILLGIVGMAVGLFTGSSPSVIESHGQIGLYGQRLAMNWAILRAHLTQGLDTVRSFLSSIF